MSNRWRWREIERLYYAAIDLDDENRSAFLAATCGADERLREEVAAMIEQSNSTGNLPDFATELVPDPDQTALAAGVRLGPYKVLGTLGEGGMGRVYRALDTRLERAVAIKISTRRFSERFVREARTISALNHPNICTLHDVGTLPSGDTFMVTELVEGETLRNWLSHSPGLERALGVIRQVVDALSAAHKSGIIHRDLKPANIMVRFDGYAKVLDFGLAKRMPGSSGAPTATLGLSVPGTIIGTVAYMSPEQLLGESADARSDLFALGIILYEIAVGRHPWPRPSAVETTQAILHEQPPPTGAPAELDRLICQCLEKAPARRHVLIFFSKKRPGAC